jgi:hypothetical protein
MSHGQTVDIVHLLDRDRKVRVVHGYLWRSRQELDKCVHLLLVEGLNQLPKPSNHCRFGRVAFVSSLAYEHFDYIR